MQMTTNDASLAANALPSWSFATIEGLMKSLPRIEDVWAGLPNSAAMAQLKQRERLLAAATLSASAFELLHEITCDLGISTVIIRHPPSVKAITKQTLLAAGLGGADLMVNKTTTVRLGTEHFLCTGAGDFVINRDLLRQVADELSLPRRVVKTCRINPPGYPAESELGLLAGMVSPFISPSMSRNQLRAVVLFAAAELNRTQGQMVAISLSPFESLVVRLADFSALTRHYAKRAYPDLHWTEICC
jgi:hypothetical protein